jgi:hypothetical protein
LATSASADVFNPHFVMGELHSAQGGNTAGSFAASAMMGAQGYSGAFIPVNWDSLITSSCTTQTGGSLWPAGCNPTGMAKAVGAYTANNWVTALFAETDEASALNLTLAAMQFLGSPAIVPIYGQADHWVAVTQITATNTGSAWVINQVKAFDGGPTSGTDSGFNAYEAGVQAWGGNTWKNIYFKVITAINPSCDPNCSSDPFFNKYVIMYEPPIGQVVPQVTANFARAPGVLPPGQNGMNELLAQMQVWQALSLAGVDADPEIWNAVSRGVPGTAFHVNAVWPSGSPWDYYLVPILSNSRTAIAFVQLAGSDGAFEGIHVLTTPVAFAPLTMAQAEQLARGALGAGESLTAGTLTWNPRSDAQLVKSSVLPYYEFGVASATSKQAGVVRVMLNGGKVARGQ